MDIQLESSPSLHRKLKITIPADIFNAEYKKIVTKLKGTIKINGFRPGKVPKSILEKRYKESFSAETVENLIPKYLNIALEKEQLVPAYQPEIGELKITLGEPLYFEANFEIKPIPDVAFSNFLELKKPDLSVSDDEMNEKIKRLQKEFGETEDTTSPAQIGNMVKIELLEENGVPVKKKMEPLDIELKDGDEPQLKNITDALLNTQAGDIKIIRIQSEPPEKSENADQADENKNTTKVLVKAVQRRIPAELNDDFLKKFNRKNIDSLDAFREFIRKDIKQGKIYMGLRTLHAEIRNTMYGKLAFALPEKILNERKNMFLERLTETENKKKEYNQRFSNKENGDNSSADKTDGSIRPYEIKSRDELEKTALENTEKDLRIMYFIDYIFEEQKLTVNKREVLDEFIEECARGNVYDPKEYMRTDDGKRLLRYAEQMAVEKKALNYLIVSKYGNDFIPIDLSPNPEDSPN